MGTDPLEAINRLNEYMRSHYTTWRRNIGLPPCTCFLCEVMERMRKMQKPRRPSDVPDFTNEYCSRFLEQLFQTKLDNLTNSFGFTAAQFDYPNLRSLIRSELANALAVYNQNANIDTMEEAVDDNSWQRVAEKNPLAEGHVLNPLSPFPQPINNPQRFPDSYQRYPVAEGIQHHLDPPVRQWQPINHQVTSVPAPVQQDLYPEQIPPRPLSSMPFTPEPEYPDSSPANSPEPSEEISDPEDYSDQQQFPEPQKNTQISGEVLAPNPEGYLFQDLVSSMPEDHSVQQVIDPGPRRMEPLVVQEISREATPNPEDYDFRQPAHSMPQDQPYLQQYLETTHLPQNNMFQQLVTAHTPNYPLAQNQQYIEQISVQQDSTYHRKIYSVRPSNPFNQHYPHMPRDYISRLISADTRLSTTLDSQQELVPIQPQDNPNVYQLVSRLPREHSLEPTLEPSHELLGQSLMHQQDSPARVGHPYRRQTNPIAGRDHTQRGLPVSPMLSSRPRRYMCQHQRTPSFEVDQIVLSDDSRPTTPDKMVPSRDTALYSSTFTSGTPMDNMDSDDESVNNYYDEDDDYETVDDSTIEAKYKNGIQRMPIEVNQSRNDPGNDNVIDLDPPENENEVEEKPMLLRDRSPISPDKQYDFGDCPICQETLGTRRVAATYCGHVFCHDCLSRNVREAFSCPSCRNHLGPGDIIPLFIYEREIPTPTPAL